MNKWEKFTFDDQWKIAYIAHEAVDAHAVPKTVAELSSYGEGQMSAQVPIEFALALEQNGIVPEIYKDQNVLQLQKYEGYHVFYGYSFSYQKKEGYIPELVFEGLDTVCEIWLNGQLLGKTENMFLKMQHWKKSCKYCPGGMILPFFINAKKSKNYILQVIWNVIRQSTIFWNLWKSVEMSGLA